MAKNRLLLTTSLKRHPEILDIPIERPIVIAGLPRTGTTHLHNLLAADPAPALAALLGEPPAGAVAGRSSGIGDPTRASHAATQVCRLGEAMMPLFKRMHEMTVDHVHEEIQLLADRLLDDALRDDGPRSPSWRDYYLAHDQTPHYEYLKTRAAVLHLPARRRAVGAEVAAAPRAVPR